MITIQRENNWNADLKISTFIHSESSNGTVFHLPEFLQYHDENKFENKQRIRFTFYKNDKLIGYFPGVVDESSDEKIFISPFGASYGGPVYHRDLDYKEIENIFDLFLEAIRSEVQKIRISVTCEFHSSSGNNLYLDYILLRNGFVISKSDIPLVHEVGTEDQIIARLDKKTATELKQPLHKNPLRNEIISGIDISSYAILMDSQCRLGSRPTHTFEELQKIEELVPGTVKTFKSFLEDKQISAITTMHVNKNVLNTFYIYDIAEGRNWKANHFGYYNVLKYASENAYKYVDFGPTTFGWTPNYPLIAFKEKFDSKPYLRHTFENTL